jgi:hypothetical protein
MRPITHSLTVLGNGLDDDQFSNIWCGKSEWLTIHFGDDANDILIDDVVKVSTTGSLKVIKGVVDEVHHFPIYGPHSETNRIVVTGAAAEVKLKDIEKYLDTKQSKLSKLIVT